MYPYTYNNWLPARTANDVKNYWHTHLRKKVVLEREEIKEEKIPKENVKGHDVIKPQPQTFSPDSPWFNRKHCSFVTQSVMDSNKDGNITKDVHDSEPIHPNKSGRDCASTSQPSNVPLPCAMWSDNLWNLGEQVGNDRICSYSSLQEDINFNTEFPNVGNYFSDSNLRDYDSSWDH
ncbi:R2R3-MYB transcription factor, putative [Medicago truncatula]|uniref:R2R3-MYB transcription factor, putative n=1 Tax=Medicago truncatula TaxID=3880 RepID=A0A072TKA1_MEDTR|nr:R2R3-MYB transcription factor, putative [Medicago truncatula]